MSEYQIKKVIEYINKNGWVNVHLRPSGEVALWCVNKKSVVEIIPKESK